MTCREQLRNISNVLKCSVICLLPLVGQENHFLISSSYFLIPAFRVTMQLLYSGYFLLATFLQNHNLLYYIQFLRVKFSQQARVNWLVCARNTSNKDVCQVVPSLWDTLVSGMDYSCKRNWAVSCKTRHQQQQAELRRRVNRRSLTAAVTCLMDTTVCRTACMWVRVTNCRELIFVDQLRKTQTLHPY